MSQGGSFLREGSLLILGNALGLPVAAHLHGSRFIEFQKKYPTLVRAVAQRANCVFVLTTESARAIRRLTATEQRVHVVLVRNAVQVPAHVAEKERTVVFAGEVGLRKGSTVLLAAWKTLAHQFPDWTLKIAGPIADGSGMARVLSETKSVQYLGVLPRSSVLEIESHASISVLPSRNEALPLFLLESMARQCAVISTPVGEIAELLEPDAGIIVPVDDVAALSAALRRLMEDDQFRHKIAAAARERILERFSEDVVAPQLMRYWVRLLDCQKSRHREVENND